MGQPEIIELSDSAAVTSRLGQAKGTTYTLFPSVSVLTGEESFGSAIAFRRLLLVSVSSVVFELP